jgi:hypothetical protein
MVAMDRTRFGGFTVPTLSLLWFIEFFNSKYKTTQGRAITGMVTNFLVPADPVNRYTNQSIFWSSGSSVNVRLCSLNTRESSRSSAETATCSTLAVAVASPTLNNQIATSASI